ncbi:MAG: GNAT family N-acetyltransferase [Alphaproteobacteria bacterium]
MRGARIEAVDASHADSLAALHAACLEEAWPAADIATLLRQPGVFAALAMDMAPIGFVLWRVAADEAEILSIGVLPSARRHGIATALLEAATVSLLAAGVASLFLEVAEDNQAALAFYRAHGFDEVGRRSRYYRRAGGREADALVLKLTFSVGKIT